MKNLRYILLTCTVLMNVYAHAQQEPAAENAALNWYTDILKANEASKAQHKPIFAFFTGSDWCGWCKKLEREVFDKPAFAPWAQKNVILLELDFPRNKPQSPELKQQNSSLQQAFQVQGFPTVWLFNMVKNADSSRYDLQALGSLGYPSGAVPGKEEVKFLSEANALLAKNTGK